MCGNPFFPASPEHVLPFRSPNRSSTPVERTARSYSHVSSHLHHMRPLIKFVNSSFEKIRSSHDMYERALSYIRLQLSTDFRVSSKQARHFTEYLMLLLTKAAGPSAASVPASHSRPAHSCSCPQQLGRVAQRRQRRRGSMGLHAGVV